MPDSPIDPTITHAPVPPGNEANSPTSGSETIAQSPDDVADAAARSADAAPASVVSIPGYVIERELGRGGMGVVYLARHLALNRSVALKMILAGEHSGVRDRLRFLAEAEAIARLRHPNIVQLYEIGTHCDCPFFTLEYCEGGALDAKLGGQPLEPQAAGTLVETIARAVHVAHEAGIVHRDLKPQNVLLSADGAPKVTDFGLAKRVDGVSDLTASGAVLGTPSYMAPEQAEGKGKEVGRAADVYALGAILYAALTGRPPFRAATPVDTIMQVVHDDPVPPTHLVPGIPRDLETICLKCLRKDPSRRYPTAADLADDLRRWHEGEPIMARPVGSAERVWKWARRRPTTAALVAVSILVAVGIVFGSIWFTDRLRVERNVARAAERSERLRAIELAAALDDARRERDEKEKARRAEIALKEEVIENDKELRLVVMTLVKAMQENAARSGGATLDIPALLAVARKYSESNPGQNARVRLGMLQMVGILYTALGRSEEAIPIVEELVTACGTVFGENHRETLSVQTNLAQLYLIAGRPLKGLALLDDAVKRQVANLGPTDPATVEGKKALARVYIISHQYQRALDLCDAVASELRQLRGQDIVDTLDLVDIAATACAKLQLREREEGYLRELIRISGLMYGTPSEPVCVAMIRLGTQLMARDKLEAAETIFRESLAMLENIATRPRSMLTPWLIPHARSLLGEALLGQKKYLAAEPLLISGAEQLLADSVKLTSTELNEVQHAIERLVKLYVALGNDQKATTWRNQMIPKRVPLMMNPPVAPES
ncbi:MAG: hypothetical protein C0467_14270 [Planctomycetaceae bacterium]|nr:hypothetical protein [Planctomycetaceae bacterium]